MPTLQSHEQQPARAGARDCTRAPSTPRPARGRPTSSSVCPARRQTPGREGAKDRRHTHGTAARAGRRQSPDRDSQRERDGKSAREKEGDGLAACAVFGGVWVGGASSADGGAWLRPGDLQGHGRRRSHGPVRRTSVPRGHQGQTEASANAKRRRLRHSRAGGSRGSSSHCRGGDLCAGHICCGCARRGCLAGHGRFQPSHTGPSSLSPTCLRTSLSLTMPARHVRVLPSPPSLPGQPLLWETVHGRRHIGRLGERQPPRAACGGSRRRNVRVLSKAAGGSRAPVLRQRVRDESQGRRAESSSCYDPGGGGGGGVDCCVTDWVASTVRVLQEQAGGDRASFLRAGVCRACTEGWVARQHPAS